MSLKHIDIEGGLRRLADRRIEEAMKEGKFSNLRGHGKSMVLDPMPAEENARLMWWALRILKNQDFTPDEVRWRKLIDQLKAELAQTRDESRVKTLVAQINAMVLKLNTLGTNAISSGVAMVDQEDQLSRLRQRLAGENGHAR
jgi:hypothetical protein